MKRTLAIAILFGALCATSAGPSSLFIPIQQDDQAVRGLLLDRPEFKPLAAECQSIIKTRLRPLPANEVEKVFGPRLDTSTYVGLNKYSTNLIVPSFSRAIVGVPSVRSGNPADNKYHTDLHAVGDIGYIEFWYDNNETIFSAFIFFRAGEKFVPLKSTNDLPKRLEWDKAKLTAFEKWLDEHLPGK